MSTALYPAETLYPSESLYPSSGSIEGKGQRHKIQETAKLVDGENLKLIETKSATAALAGN